MCYYVSVWWIYETDEKLEFQFVALSRRLRSQTLVDYFIKFIFAYLISFWY